MTPENIVRLSTFGIGAAVGVAVEILYRRHAPDRSIANLFTAELVGSLIALWTKNELFALVSIGLLAGTIASSGVRRAGQIFNPPRNFGQEYNRNYIDGVRR